MKEKKKIVKVIIQAKITAMCWFQHFKWKEFLDFLLSLTLFPHLSFALLVGQKVYSIKISQLARGIVVECIVYIS